MVGMADRLHDRVGTFSRGMQQRLSIARAVLHKPALMLLDEPETGLDQQAISILRDVLKASDGTARTIIMTTHNLERGLELSDRMLILAKGKICCDRPTKGMDLAELARQYRESTGAPA